MTERDPYIRAQFPDGSIIVVRCENSGVVFDPKTDKPIDEELAVDMLQIKASKFARQDPVGNA